MKSLRMILLILVIGSLMLVACGGDDAADTTDTGSSDTEVAAPAGEKVQLRLWSHQNAAFQEGNQAIIDKFMEENPNIEVTYETFEYDLFIQTLQTSMPAGTEADVLELFGTWVCSYAAGGRLLPMPKTVMSYEEAQQLFYQAPLDGYYCDGELYGLPQEFNLEVGGALMNPALFEAHGIAYPPEWNNFSEMIADAAQMSEYDGETMLRSGFNYVTSDGLGFALTAAILQQGASYFAEDGRHFNFESPESINAIQLLMDIAQKDNVVDPILFNDDSNWVGDSFFAGNVAIGFVGSWAAGEGLLNYPDMDFDYLQIPPYFGNENVFAADAGWGKVVSVNTKHPEEALKLAKFMAAEKANALVWNTSTATIPALKELVASPDELLAKAPFLESTFSLLPNGQYLGNLTDRDQLWYEIIYPHMLDAIQGNITAEEAAKNINTEANAMVDASQ